MVLSKSCEYGIRAALLVSIKELQNNRTHIPVRELSKELNISFHFLTKILRRLTNAKLLVSYRGPNGGVRLAKNASSIYIIDIIKAIDGLDIFNSCILGLPECSGDYPCPLHKQWRSKRNQMFNMFKTQSLSQLAKNRTKFKLSG